MSVALEAVVYHPNSFWHAVNKDLNNFLGAGESWSYQEFIQQQTEDGHGHSDSPSSTIPYLNGVNLSYTSSDSVNVVDASNQTQSCGLSTLDASTAAETMPAARPKRQGRARSRKNKEEIENQRMTHIALERNRRKQVNEYLSLLRSLMPESYLQRSDQASIIGSAIHFVKELEQNLQLLVARKETDEGECNMTASGPFSELFTFPQYSTNPRTECDNPTSMGEKVGQVGSGIADIEVTWVESHANMKIRLKRRSKQLAKIVSGLHSLRLTVLHLNITTHNDTVLYSLTMKVENDSKMSSVDEIAEAVYKLLENIHHKTIISH